MAVTKVISGGQIGADQAGLRAGKACGLETGGHAPKGWRTKRGSNPGLGTVYGLEEHSSDRYPPRTYLNVKNADATIRLAVNFASAGERSTMKAIQQYHKPHIDVPFVWNGTMFVPKLSPDTVRWWLNDHNVEILNVAGNALVALEQPVYEFLREALQLKGG